MALNLIFSVVCLFIGVGLLASGLFLFFRQRARIARSLAADGDVIEVLRRRVEGRLVRVKTEDGMALRPVYRYRLVVAFETQSGQAIRFSPSLASRPAPFEVGERVRVLYDPADPQQAQIDQVRYLWFSTAMLLFFGVFTLGMGLLGIVMQSS